MLEHFHAIVSYDAFRIAVLFSHSETLGILAVRAVTSFFSYLYH